MVPVLIDVENGGVNVDVESLVQNIESLDALFITNVLGLNNSLSDIRDACIANGVQLYEDNCESLGCYQDEELMGNFGIASTTSSFIDITFQQLKGGTYLLMMMS